ncbi:MAG: hypothetical protein WAK01_02275 [Methylocystis sp.]
MSALEKILAARMAVDEEIKMHAAGNGALYTPSLLANFRRQLDDMEANVRAGAMSGIGDGHGLGRCIIDWPHSQLGDKIFSALISYEKLLASRR